MCPQRKWCGLKQNIFFDASMFPFPQKAVGHFLNYQIETKRLQARDGHYSEGLLQIQCSKLSNSRNPKGRIAVGFRILLLIGSVTLKAPLYLTRSNICNRCSTVQQKFCDVGNVYSSAVHHGCHCPHVVVEPLKCGSCEN